MEHVSPEKKARDEDRRIAILFYGVCSLNIIFGVGLILWEFFT